MVIVLLFAKPCFLPYPPLRAFWEFVLVLAHIPLHSLRNWFGTAGNKQERAIYMAVFLLGTVWSALVVGYFWKEQLYVLRIESMLAATNLGLIALETLGGALLAVSFCDAPLDLLAVVLSGLFALGALLIAFLVYDGKSVA